MQELIRNLRQCAAAYGYPPTGREVIGTRELLKETIGVLERLPDTIYILERDNPKEKPFPETYIDPGTPKAIVRAEYKATMEALSTTQEKADAGDGPCGCYWNFSEDEDDPTGDALIDTDYEGDRYEWRVTAHRLKFGGKQTC